MKRDAFTIRELLIVIAVVAVLLALLFPALMTLREREARTQTFDRLKQLTLAMHGCNDVHKKLPPATGPFGKPKPVNATVHVHILPFIEQDQLYRAIVDGEGDDLGDVVVPQFISPLDDSGEWGGIAHFAGNLRVFSALGVKTGYLKAISPDANGNDPETALPWYHGNASIPRTFFDGTSATLSFCTQFSVCGKLRGKRMFTRSAGMRNNSPFFGYHAPVLQATGDAGIPDGQIGEIFQIMPAEVDCNPSYTSQAMRADGLLVATFDGSVRAIDPGIAV